MDKIRITMSVASEYEVNPTWYPEGISLDEMAKIDLGNYENEPERLLEDPDARYTFSYEVIKGGN